VSAVNSVAVLDLDKEVGTNRLESSLVSPIELDGQVKGVLAFYSNQAQAFSEAHRADAEWLAHKLAARLDVERNAVRVEESAIVPSPIAASLAEFKTPGRWPVGIIVTLFSSRLESASTQQQALGVLRESVRNEDSLLQIEANAFLLLLLRSDDSATGRVVSRLQDEFMRVQIPVEIEWASVGQEGASDSQAFISLTEVIRRKAEKASERSRQTTH
jgi:hypothetical protein